MAEVNAVVRQMKSLRRRAGWCEVKGRWEEAAGLWEEHGRAEALLWELRRADRVGRRRARIRRNAELYAGDVKITHPDDVAFMLRLAIEIDRGYYPDAYPS